MKFDHFHTANIKLNTIIIILVINMYNNIYCFLIHVKLLYIDNIIISIFSQV